MGILNITPDSFSDGGFYLNEHLALKHAEKMIKDGADIIDIGLQSTRPNAEKITAQEEIKRMGNIISSIKKEFPNTLISLDTFYTETLKKGYDEGIDIVNDISAGQFDENFLEMVKKTALPYILMHINPSYETMHQVFTDEKIIEKINFYFSEKINQILELGIKDVILDPGFGFGKNIEQQFYMIENFNFFSEMFPYPFLIGISRKSFIYKTLNKKPLDNEVLEKCLILQKKLIEKGAQIIRTHDVLETKNSLQK